MSIFVKKPLLCGIAINITIRDTESMRRVFKEILKFEVIYEKSNQEYVFNCPQLSKHLFIHIKQDIVCMDKLSKEHVLIFYLNDINQYMIICEKLILAGAKKEMAINPYWNEKGSTFLINDTLRMIFCPGGYKNYKARIAAPAANLENLVNLLQDLGWGGGDRLGWLAS